MNCYFLLKVKLLNKLPLVSKTKSNQYKTKPIIITMSAFDATNAIATTISSTIATTIATNIVVEGDECLNFGASSTDFEALTRWQSQFVE